MKTHTKLVWLELVSGLLGWAWILSSVAAMYFLVAALAFHHPWSRLWWAVGSAIIAKWLARGFADNQARVAFEADLVSKGHSPEDAGKEWAKRYARDPSLRP